MTLALTTSLIPLAAALLLQSDAPRSDAPDLSLSGPVRLMLANGEPLDVGQYGGYAAPVMLPVADDGSLELLVGTFRGNIDTFKLTEGTWSARGLLRAGDGVLKLNNW